jgi:archaellum biogenesis ATPase FlaH
MTQRFMDSDTQYLYLRAMLHNPDIFTRVNPIVNAKFFDERFQDGIKFMKEHFEKYRTLPSASIFKTATKLDAGTPQENKVDRGDKEWMQDNIAEFCRTQAAIDAVRQSLPLIEAGRYDDIVTLVKRAAEIRLNVDIGIDYFNDPQSRLEQDESEDLLSTGWKDVDAVIGGGCGRQELVFYLAPSGGGKSVSMLNHGINLLMQGYHGVYISLEMRDKKVALRADQMITRMTSGMVNLNKREVADELQKFSEKFGSKFFIKRMRETTTTSTDINAYINQLEVQYHFRPDFIIVDYVDILGSAHASYDNLFLKDKFVSEEIRALGFDWNALVITASQLGKHSTEAINEGKKMHQGDVQGGSSKTNTADLMIACIKTDAMHEAGEYKFEFPKARNSDANTKFVMMGWDKDSLRITDYDDLHMKKKPRSSLQMESVVAGRVKPKSLDDLNL